MRFVRWTKLMVLSFTRIAQMLFQLPTGTLSSPILKSTTLGEWDFNISPSLNSTSHLVFDSVGSLLQHWTNTRYRNGILRSNSYTREMIDIFFFTFSKVQYRTRNRADWYTPLPWHLQARITYRTRMDWLRSRALRPFLPK